ncbi:hypothetical protein [Chryseobacterium profundimaris]|uniref:Uncharacterized protein n=1 Tax=Chryseobacterium profundimaris TaxID=1387275 RepID=A0ABY1PK79_9FLAO|nr:hypothetical protein [Chryseobacterium profundimaris]SMP34196.1 hypothetical protein SAMN06264346_11755 [Chryseobacterium profundimaris]
MRRKVFRYKFVYWIILLLNIFLFVSFSLGVYNRIETNYFDDLFDVLSFIIINVISILSLISLVLLIKKNKESIIVFSGVLLLILFIILSAIFYSIFIVKDFGENTMDFYLAPALCLMIWGILFGMHKFKYKQNLYEFEIEEIGKHNE